MLSDTARHRLMVAIPLLFAALLTALHPIGGSSFYEGIDDNQTRWITIHLAGLVMFPAMEIIVWQVLSGVEGHAAHVGRWALVPFAVFYVAWEAVIGIATWVLVRSGQPPSSVDALLNSPIVGDPGLLVGLGSIGWIVALIACAVAYRADGASRMTTFLIGAGSIMTMHPPPFGPVALVAFAAGIHRVRQERARRAALPATWSPEPVIGSAA